MFNLNVIAISRSIDEDLAPPPTSPLSVVPSEKFAGVCLPSGSARPCRLQATQR